MIDVIDISTDVVNMGREVVLVKVGNVRELILDSRTGLDAVYYLPADLLWLRGGARYPHGSS